MMNKLWANIKKHIVVEVLVVVLSTVLLIVGGNVNAKMILAERNFVSIAVIHETNRQQDEHIKNIMTALEKFSDAIKTMNKDDEKTNISIGAIQADMRWVKTFLEEKFIK